MTYMRTYSHYRRRMREIVTDMQGYIGDGELWEENADDYGWHLTLGDGSDRESIDIALMLEDAMSFEGDDGKGQGAFGIRAIRHGGEILADYTPHNFTPDVWVQLSQGHYPELDARLALIADAAIEIAETVRYEREGAIV